MSELIGEYCEHYMEHEIYYTSLSEDGAVDYACCQECGEQWKYERGLTTSESAEILNRKLSELWDTILKDVGLR